MYEKILVPLDGSELSEAVLPSVKEMAQRLHAKVTLFHAVVPRLERTVFTDDFSSTVYIDQEIDQAQYDAEVYLRKVAKGLTAEGIEVNIVIGMGSAADEILRAADKVGADMIAMSTHGRTGLGRLIHGSVATKVLKNANKPVVLIKPELRVAQAA